MQGGRILGLSWVQGRGKVAMATGLVAASLLLPITAVHADSSATISVDAKAGPVAGYNLGEYYEGTTDPTGSYKPADTGLHVTAATTNIRITYTGGTITIAHDNKAPFTPDGTSNGGTPSGTPVLSTHVPLMSARFAQLLYRIGPDGGGTIGTVFANPPIPGTYVDVPLPPGKTGELYLFINDTQYYDNQGAYNVNVVVTDPSVTDQGGGIHPDGTATPEAPAGLLLAVGMIPLAGLAAWRRKRTQRPQARV